LSDQGRTEETLRLLQGCRVVAWITVPGRVFEAGRALKKSARALRIKRLYLGRCYGRFDLVLDFYEPSERVASFRLSELRRRLARTLGGEQYLLASLLCTPIAPQKNPYARKDQPIVAYTFLSNFVKNHVDVIRRVVPQDSSIESEFLWNTTAYPEIVVFRAYSMAELFGALRGLKNLLVTQSKGTDVFTVVTLGMGRGFAEEKPAEVMAITSIHFDDPFKLHLARRYDDQFTWFDKYRNPVWRTGWFDLCWGMKKKTLREVADTVAAIQRVGGLKLQTSTVLLDAGNQFP